MKILVDIIHPANVHYFKHFIFKMKEDGHKIYITSRNKDVALKLLESYQLNYINLGKGSIGKGALGKILYIILAEFRFLYLLLKLKPDITLSFGSAPLAHISWILKIPHISFDDTEHAKLNKKLYLPFTPLVISPSCFYDNLGDNHIRFDGYMELFYLHHKRFKPNKNVLSELNINKSEPFTLFRFVSWGAFHDIGQQGLTDNEKIELIKLAELYGKVYISSEQDLPDELKKYELRISPDKLHDLLYYSKLYVGEGGTTASECAMLGTPSIYINSLPLMGYLKDAQDNNLLFHLNEMEKISDKMNEILSNKYSPDFFELKKEEMLKDCIDPTAYLIWLVKDYPKSAQSLREHPNIQLKFK